VSTALDPPFVFELVEGTGHATHLGRFTVVIPHLVDTSTRIAIGSYQLTAANGDLLFADFIGQASPAPMPVVLFIEETATITGGTGRFAGAGGGFTVERLFDTVAGTTVGFIGGAMSSPGAAKRRIQGETGVESALGAPSGRSGLLREAAESRRSHRPTGDGVGKTLTKETDVGRDRPDRVGAVRDASGDGLRDPLAPRRHAPEVARRGPAAGREPAPPGEGPTGHPGA
jgi:hypothetical protein